MDNEGFKINLPQDENENASAEENIPAAEAAPDFNLDNIESNILYGGMNLEEYNEKQNIKSSCRTVGLCFILSFFILLLINVATVIATVILSSFSLEKILEDPAVMQVMQIGFSILIFLIPFVIIPKASGYRLSDIVPLGKSAKNSFLPLFLFGISFCSFANIATNYAAMFFENIGIDYDVDFGDNPEGIFGFLLTLISTVAVPALVEEFALRGVVQGILKKHGEGFAVICSAIIFGVMHRNFQQMPFAFLVGLVLGYITVKSGTLWPAVAVHAFNNGVSVIIDYLGKYISVEQQNIIYTVFLIATLILGLLAFTVIKNEDGLYSFNKANTVTSEGKKIKMFIFSAPIIIYTVLCLLESCIYFFI